MCATGSATGPWQLRIEDVATGAVGHLDSWILYL
jgi:subtilisin-like proprotein convertase family protein